MTSFLGFFLYVIFLNYITRQNRKGLSKNVDFDMNFIDASNNRNIINGSTVFFGDQILIEIKASLPSIETILIIILKQSLKIEKVSISYIILKIIRTN